MANLLQRLFTPDYEETKTRLTEATTAIRETQAVASARSFEAEDIKESMRELTLWLEDRNWEPIEGYKEHKGFDLKTIKEQADRARALLTVNPVIKKASDARIGYVWGKGVAFEGAPTRVLKDPFNQSNFFNDYAYEELERLLQTDGNIFALRSKQGKEVALVPLEQIAGWSLNEEDPSRVEYWLRRYTIEVEDYRTGVITEKVYESWYPAEGQGGTVKTIQNIPVVRSSEMIHKAVNRQKGWILGLPDIIVVMFWTKAHKELFESGTTFVKAQGKFASKVVSKTAAGAQRSAAAVAEAPRRDERTGEVLDIGGTAVMSAGLDMQLMGKMSGGVDFNVFEPVLGLVAAGFNVPLSVLTAKAGAEEETLELSVVTAAQSRQKLWTEFYTAVFGRPNSLKVTWPRIKVESTYRQVQAIEIANKTNKLSDVELRQLSLEAFDIVGDPNQIPKIEENPAYAVPAELAKLNAKLAADAAEKAAEDAQALAAAQPDATTPEQGVDAGVGKLSTGSDAKDARDKGEIASAR